MRVVVGIPARMGSSRFPGKPLKLINGIPMIGHCYYRTKLCNAFDEIYVATCDMEIVDYVESIGGKAIMTSDLERVYKLKIEGEVTKAMISAMDNGITLDDATAGAWDNTKTINMEFKPFLGYQVQTSSAKYSKLKVAISEGKNRELRRFFAHFGSKVVDLKRVSFGGINLNNLPSGKVRYLERDEYENMRDFMKQQNKVNRKKTSTDLYDDEY